MLGASFKEFRERTVVFLVAWLLFAAEKWQSVHKFVFAWHGFVFLRSQESNFAAEKVHAAVYAVTRDCSEKLKQSGKEAAAERPQVFQVHSTERADTFELHNHSTVRNDLPLS